MTTDPDEACTVRNRSDIVAILEGLLDRPALTTIAFGAGESLVSRLLELQRHAGAMVFDLSRDPAQNRRLFAAERLSFVAESNRVPIRFETPPASLVVVADGPAALVDLPTSLVRLQRRECFRVVLPPASPIACTVRDRHGHAHAARPLDLSCSGAGLMLEDADSCLGQAGSTHDLTLSLPETGPIQVQARLRRVLPMRAGFSFEALPPRTARQIQQFVQRAEVLRRKR